MKKLTIYVSEETHRQLKVATAQCGETVTATVERLIQEWLQKQKALK